MQDSTQALHKQIRQHFSGDRRRTWLIARLIISLIIICNVSYNALALVLNAAVGHLSNFKRIQRFFKHYRFCHKSYVSLIFALLNKCYPNQLFTLAMDRTNWKFGQTPINILMVAIVYNGTAIPLIWETLPKTGNSNQQERISLLEDLWQLLSPEQRAQISCLTMDREFVGKKWLKYLHSIKLFYVLRLKKNTLAHRNGKSKAIWQLFDQQKYCCFRKTRKVCGVDVYLSGGFRFTKDGEKEYVVFASNLAGAKAKIYYSQRWGIEVLFGDLKSRGFNFENTHVTNIESLQMMIYLLAIAYIWAVKTGEWAEQKGQQIPLKNIKGKIKKLYSTFSWGLSILRAALIHQLNVNELVGLLSCT